MIHAFYTSKMGDTVQIQYIFLFLRCCCFFFFHSFVTFVLLDQLSILGNLFFDFWSPLLQYLSMASFLYPFHSVLTSARIVMCVLFFSL